MTSRKKPPSGNSSEKKATASKSVAHVYSRKGLGVTRRIKSS